MRGSSPKGQHTDSLIHRADLSLPLVGSQQLGEEKIKKRYELPYSAKDTRVHGGSNRYEKEHCVMNRQGWAGVDMVRRYAKCREVKMGGKPRAGKPRGRD